MRQKLEISMKTIGTLALMLVTTAAFAQSPTLDCSVDGNDLMQVIIEAKGINLSVLNKASAWTLYSHSKSTKTITRLLITDTDVIAVPVPGSPLNEESVRLILSGPLSLADVDNIAGMVATDKEVIPITKCTLPTALSAEKSQQFQAATGKSDSDIYFNGSYTATVGGAPTYSIDSFAGYMHAVGPREAFWGKLGMYGQVTTKAGSTSPSPNSYLTYAVFQRVLAKEGGWLGPFQTPIFNYRFAGGEFAQQGNNVNFVTSPVVTFPIRFTAGTLGAIRPGLTIPHMTILAGTEFVNTISSALPEASWLTRGLLGATFTAGYTPKKPYLDSLLLTAAYQLRLLSSPEVYYNDKYAPVDPKTGKKGTTPPRIGSQPRSYVDTKLTYNFTKWAGFTCEYTYGSLPPAFVLTHSTFTLGLTFTLQQTSYGRYSILRP
jgi:hypothetical protein